MFTWTLETSDYAGLNPTIDYFYNENDFMNAVLKQLNSDRVINYAEKCGGEED